MSSRRRAPPDMAAVKKSRASYTGAVTKAIDKLTGIPKNSQEEVRGIKTKDIDRLLLSLERTEKGFNQSIEDALEFIPTDEDDELVFQETEETAQEAFFNSLSLARDAADQLLGLKSVLNGLSYFKTDLDALQESLDEKPETNQAEALQALNTLYSKLRQEWQTANLDLSHPIKTELDSCSKVLTCLGADVVTARSKSDSHSSITSSSHSTDHTIITSGCCSSKSDLPVIEVPKLYGNIMAWSTFWASFESTIGSRKDLDDTKRLHYLRMAIKDEDAKKLLYSPTETPGFYQEVVAELKRRYDRTTEVHRELTKSILELQTPKQTRLDLRRLTDQVRRLIGSFKATGFYTIEAFLCSAVYLLLPAKLQTLWDQHTKRTKGVPAIERLLEFLQDHAEALPATVPSNSHQKEAENTAKRPSRNSNPTAKGNKSHVNAAAAPAAAPPLAAAPPPPATSPGSAPAHNYKWDCFLCKTEKHPLFICPKWAALSVSQRLGHVKNRNLCSNCLSMGHLVTNCKSSYRCRPCGQQHHSSLHQDTSAPTVNSTTATRRQMPDALMTTAQVLLTGPRGQEVKARALIDSGAGLSLITHGMAQKLGLPLTPSKLTLFGVQGVSGRPAKYLTELDISPVLGPRKKIHCSPVVVKTVTGNLPGEPVNSVHHLDHMVGLQLADETYNVPGKIDILLGTDLAPQIMVKQVLRSGTETEPMAQATLFGWVISGPATSSLTPTIHAANHAYLQPEEPLLTDVVQEFWATEEAPGDEELSLSAQEQQAESHYVQNTHYSESSCRYTVSLPKRMELFPLGDSKVQATGRYLSSEAHNRRRGITEAFQTEVRKYLELGHAEKVPPEEEDAPTDIFYLPMHAVFKDSSTSTKLRVVFDGSASTTSGRSLNQSLLVGPTLQPTLTEILLKFRTYRIAMNADIT